MKKGKVWLLVGVLFSLVCASSSGTERRFFRITCVEGGAPENLTITSDEFGQIFLEFDTQDQRSYLIEATDSLSPSPAWTGVSVIVGDGQRATWLTTRRWSRTFGGTAFDEAFSVQQTSDGGYIVAGDTGSFGAGGPEVYLIKTDQNGSQLWTKTFGRSNYDYGYSVQQTSDGGYIVAGVTFSYGAGNVYLIKTDADGNEVWSKTFGGSDADYAYSVRQTSDGGYIVAGLTDSFGAGSGDVYLIKTDPNGNEVWTRTFGGDDDDTARCVQQTSDGGYIVAASTKSFGAGGWDAYLIKTNKSGNEVWSRTFGGSESDQVRSVQQTSDGGYIVAASTKSFGAGGYDVYLIKTDAVGNEVWSRAFGGGNWDMAVSIQQTSDGGYIVAGYTSSFGAGQRDVYLIKTDAVGNEVWSRTLGGSEEDIACCVQETSDGGYIVAGYTTSFGAGDWDVYLIKTDRNGNAPPPEPTLISVVVSGPGEVKERPTRTPLRTTPLRRTGMMAQRKM